MLDSELKRWTESQKKLEEWRKQNKNNPLTESEIQCNNDFDSIAKFIAKIIKHGKLLDVGCGSGTLKKNKYFPKNLEYNGLDPLPIEGVVYDFPYNSVIIENAVSVYGTDAFDAVIIKDSIDYMVNQNDAFFVLKEILKQNGLLLITEAGRGRADRNYLLFFRIFFNILRWLIKKFIKMPKVQVNDLINKQKIMVIDTYPAGYIETSSILNSAASQGFRLILRKSKNYRLNLVFKIKK